MSSSLFELRLEHGDCERRISLSRGETIAVGRSATAGFFLTHGSVSRRHALFVAHSHGVEVQDLGSRNGMAINGRRIDRFFLSEDSIVQIGRVPFRVRIKTAPDYSLRCMRCRKNLQGWQPKSHAPEWRPVCSGCEIEELDAQVRQMRDFLIEEGFEPERELSQRPYSAIVAHPQLKGQKFRIKAVPLPVHPSETEFSRFRKIARSIAPLEVPGLLRLIDVRSANDILYVITEAPLAPTLRERVEREGPQPLARCLTMARALLEATRACSAEKIFNLTLSPSEIVLPDDGAARIMDLQVDSAMRVMATNAVLDDSEVWSFAPETLLETIRADERADLFSVAACLVYALTGRQPFAPHSAPDLARAALLGLSLEPALGDLPQALQPWLRSMLAVDPGRRPASPELAQAMLDEAAMAALMPGTQTPLPLAPEEAFQANVLGDQLSEVLLILEKASATGSLEVLDLLGGASGQLELSRGQITKARFRDREGAEAILQLVRLGRANYVFEPRLPEAGFSSPQTISAREVLRPPQSARPNPSAGLSAGPSSGLGAARSEDPKP